MNFRFVFTLLFFSLLSMENHAAQKICPGFMPPNTLSIPVGGLHAMSFRTEFRMPGGIKEKTFTGVLDRIQKIYGPVIKQRGGKLTIIRNWTDPTVNAYAERWGTNYEISMFGGLARHPAIGEEGFALVACHEIGHHLGGAPKMDASWPTNEGGADYFSTLKCMRYFYEGSDNETWSRTQEINALVRQKCSQTWKSKADQFLCLRVSVGSQQVGIMLADAASEAQGPHFETPDTSRVRETDDRHPEPQCRLDTLFKASLCTVAKSASQSDTEYRRGSCTGGNVGARARCWFAP